MVSPTGYVSGSFYAKRSKGRVDEARRMEKPVRLGFPIGSDKTNNEWEAKCESTLHLKTMTCSLQEPHPKIALHS